MDLLQGIARAQEQIPIKPQTTSCLDTAAILQLLQQQQHESQAQSSAEQAARVSVGCQTRQGDTWRVHSEACQGKLAEESGSWAQHGSAVTMTCDIIVVTFMMIVAVMLSFMSISTLLSFPSPVPCRFHFRYHYHCHYLCPLCGSCHWTQLGQSIKQGTAVCSMYIAHNANF